jgi:hypothetical protein
VVGALRVALRLAPGAPPPAASRCGSAAPAAARWRAWGERCSSDGVAIDARRSRRRRTRAMRPGRRSRAGSSPASCARCSRRGASTEDVKVLYRVPQKEGRKTCWIERPVAAYTRSVDGTLRQLTDRPVAPPARAPIRPGRAARARHARGRRPRRARALAGVPVGHAAQDGPRGARAARLRGAHDVAHLLPAPRQGARAAAAFFTTFNCSSLANIGGVARPRAVGAFSRPGGGGGASRGVFPWRLALGAWHRRWLVART